MLRVPIQLGFSHAVGAAEFGLFASGAPPSASARWVVVGGGLGLIEKVRRMPLGTALVLVRGDGAVCSVSVWDVVAALDGRLVRRQSERWCCSGRDT